MSAEEVLGCGNSEDGQLGLGGIDENMRIPTPLSLTEELRYCLEIVCGRKHTVFLLHSGALLACGNNDFCQLGYEGPRKKPRIVDSFSDSPVVQVGCGDAHTIALTDDGHVHSWGNNESGQLGAVVSEAARANCSVFICEVNLCKIVQVACGSEHCLALEANGVVHAWGSNDFGQLGFGHVNAVPNPQPVTHLYGIPFMQIAAGSWHSFANSSSGSVYGWGKNSCGQLGVGDTLGRHYPVLVKSLKSQRIVRLVCGEDFTSAISAGGQLFTFGSGTYGQLGHGYKNNEVLPKQVLELMGTRVLDVACGRCHTLALTKEKVYAFGLNTSGQLGLPDVKDFCLIPQAIPCRVSTRVFAGGEFSFLLYLSSGSWTDQPGLSSLDQRSIVTFDLSKLKRLAENSPTELSEYVGMAMSNLNCLNGSFLKDGMDRFCVSANNVGIDLDHAMECFKLLADHCAATADLEKIMVKSLELSIIPSLCASPPGIEALRIYVILPWCHAFLFPDNYRNIVVPFACCFVALGANAWKIIRSWWQKLPVRHLNRVLKVFKQVVIYFVNLQASSANVPTVESTFRQSAIKYSLEVLSQLHQVNKKTRTIPFSNFYINELETKVDIRTDYVGWLSRKTDNDFSFCFYPFVFNAVVKALLLQIDMAIQMQLRVNEAEMSYFHSLFTTGPITPFLILTVSRQNIVEDTIAQLFSITPNDLKKPIKADDVGGVKKEFFLLLFQELLNPKFGMFVEYSESKRIWFSNVTFEDPKTFQFVGILCGLAIYNGVIVALPFPLALYRKLLMEPVTVEDLKELSPTEGRSLEQLLDYEEDDFESVFSLAFQTTVCVFGENKTIELKPNGSDISVTKENRQEFVDLYVDYKLNKSINALFEAFSNGFFRVLTSHLVKFFQPEELMELVIGNEHYDWYEFEKCTEYRGEYWRDHPTIKIFWEVFHSLTNEQKKKFLLFLTGSDRIPFLGMSQVKMIIQPTGGGSNYYPVAHTCFNLLDLPKFTSKASLADKLTEAIEYNQGFTLI
uniref:HECT domain-containing protein n=1 Tax=Trichuris muris TaxID=70415 RepID=A0A5S6R1R1_TRIMR